MTDHTQYKSALEAELATLTTDLEAIAVLNTETGDWVAVTVTEDIGSADENVVADTTEEWNERRALLGQLEVRYHHITLALTKITDGTFGTCEICGEAIESDRLSANPAARTCKLHLERERELPF